MLGRNKNRWLGYLHHIDWKTLNIKWKWKSFFGNRSWDYDFFGSTFFSFFILSCCSTLHFFHDRSHLRRRIGLLGETETVRLYEMYRQVRLTIDYRRKTILIRLVLFPLIDFGVELFQPRFTTRSQRSFSFLKEIGQTCFYFWNILSQRKSQKV